MFFMEGIDETLSKTIGDDNVTTDSSEPKIKVSTALKESEEKEEDDDGVDKQTVHESIQPIESAAIPVNKGDFKSIDVAPLDPDNVKQGFSLLYS